PSESSTTPEPSAPPRWPATWIATTDSWTAAVTSVQFGFSTLELLTGTLRLFDWPTSASDAAPDPSSETAITPAVPRLASSAAAAAALTTGTQVRLRGDLGAASVVVAGTA